MKYCKRCGEWLGNTVNAEAPKFPRMAIVGIFWSIAALGLFGLIALLSWYQSLWDRGARDINLWVPFVLGGFLLGAIAGLMIWQLSRLISGYQQSNRNITPERPPMREFHPVQPSQLAAPTDPIAHSPQAVERPSVAEHTTRQMARPNREPSASE
ncbi:MAG: hypothetical protein L0220_13305 [Acidobacteria bacterium]|nr:hypothetical protein [Acidobacteriota bacterium]